LERDLEHRLGVAPAAREAATAASEEAAEEVVGVPAAAELELHAVATEALEPLEVPGRRTAVVARALVRVAQHLVGLRDLLEAVLGVGLLVDVGVVGARETAVGAADLLLARVAVDA